MISARLEPFSVPPQEAQLSVRRQAHWMWINAEGNGVTKGFLDYCMPLIQGETDMVKEDGLPRFVHLKDVFAK